MRMISGFSALIHNNYRTKTSSETNNIRDLDSRAYLTWYKEARELLGHRSLDEVPSNSHKIVKELDGPINRINYDAINFKPETNSHKDSVVCKTIHGSACTDAQIHTSLTDPYLCCNASTLKWGKFIDTPFWLDPQDNSNDLLGNLKYFEKPGFSIKKPNRNEEAARRLTKVTSHSSHVT